MVRRPTFFSFLTVKFLCYTGQKLGNSSCHRSRKLYYFVNVVTIQKKKTNNAAAALSKWPENVILWFGMPKLCHEAVAIATAIEIYWLRSVSNAIQPRLDWGSEGRISQDRITRQKVSFTKFFIRSKLVMLFTRSKVLTKFTRSKMPL